jgi:hypothetical protein
MAVHTLSYCPVVGGIPKGSGTGKSKQAAKEEAARRAVDAMGWAGGASGPYHCAFSPSIGRVAADIRQQRDAQFVLRRGKDVSDCYRCIVYIVSENERVTKRAQRMDGAQQGRLSPS